MLTDSNDGAKLRLLVFISSVDGDGAEENESENCEEHERHGTEEVSTLPPRRATSRTRDHDEGRGRSMLNALAVWGFISDAQVAGTWHNVFGTDLYSTTTFASPLS